MLFICLAAPFAGTFTWLQYKKQLVKKEVKWKMIEGLDKEELVLLRFTAEETQTLLKWKHPGEFEFNGEMYDIVESFFAGDSVFYYCWWDHDETHLNKQLNGLIARAAGQNEQTKDRVNKMYQFFKSLYFDEQHDNQTFLFATNLTISCLYQNNFHSRRFPPPVPPPQSLDLI